METPAPAAPPHESAMGWNVKTTQQFISEIVAVHLLVSPSSMVSSNSKLEFHNLLTKLTPTPAARVTDVYTDTSSTSPSTSMTNTTVSSHDLQEASETTTNNIEAIHALSKIAQRMRSEGHVSDCIQVYKTVRKAFLRTTLQLFGVEKRSTNDMRCLFLSELEERTDRCVKACNASCSILFPAEMELCALIFEGDERTVCYSETIQDTLIQLIGYADSLIRARRLPELLFKYLDLHKALLDTWSPPGFLRTKHLEDSAKIHILNLVEKIKCILSDFEKSVINELSTISTTPEAGGGIVGLTKYVMHYLTRISEYKGVLTDLIVSKPPSTSIGGSEKIPDVEYAQLGGRTPLELHVVYIVVLLRFKIESKSKNYYKADSAESYLFLTNNLAHIVRCIGQSPKLEDMIGISYMNKLRENYLKQAMMKYQRKTCDKMLRCLRNNTVVRCFPGVPLFTISTATTFKRKMKSFYTMFEEACSNQARWATLLVTELWLQEEIFVPIEEELVAAYTTFLERFKYKVGMVDYHVNYSPEQIQTLITRDFFKI